jgi:hypothetical protein
MLEMNPDSVLPAISVQREWNGCKGIVRGVKDERGFLVEDHIREEIRGGQLVDTQRPIVGADEMRKQTWTVDQHISCYRNTHTRENVLGWVGNGNLLSNPHFVAFAEGQFVALGSETQYLSSRRYTSLVVRKPGHKRVAIEPITYRLTSGNTQIFNASDDDITEEMEYATFGQQIVRQGQPICRDELKKMAANQQFYDLRHLFLFGRMPAGEKRWLDAGLGAFWDDGILNIKTVEAAMEGDPIQVDVRQFSEAAVLSAMDAKGYDRVDSPKERGQFSMKNGKLTMVLSDGIYPHNIIGIRRDGIVISVVLRGLSNRLGVSILGAGEIMENLGAQDAVILDNGGDVMMNFCGDQVLGSAEGERNRLRSIMLFRQVDSSTGLAPDDFRLVSYPKQISPST